MPKAAKATPDIRRIPRAPYTIYCWSCRMDIPARYWKYDKDADTHRCPICGGKEG